MSHFVAVFISPHLDDAVFSCGGMIARLASKGPVLVINVFSNYPADVCRGPVVISRKRFEEERHAADLLGFTSVYLDEIDAALRHPAYQSPANLFRQPVPDDLRRLDAISNKITSHLSSITYDSLYLPLAIGWHVDHVLCYLATKDLHPLANTFLYEDAPYCLIPHTTHYRIREIGIIANSANDRTFMSRAFILEWHQVCRHYLSLAPVTRMRPWPVRAIARLVVSVYLGTLLYQHRKRWDTGRLQYRLKPTLMDIGAFFPLKMDGCHQYASQIREFFMSREDCVAHYRGYSESMTLSLEDKGTARYERFWQFEPFESGGTQ